MGRRRFQMVFLLLLATVSPLLGIGCDECREAADCDDGQFCNGRESCASGSCRPAPNVAVCDDEIACTTDSCDEQTDSCENTAVDRDGDEHFGLGCGGDDCDDDDPARYGGAPELCDGLDNDCDDLVEEDQDGDGCYDLGFCPDEGDDCDDSDPSIHPGASEVCDGKDNNCVDGINDEEDTDADGFVEESCGGDDCDDENGAIHPGAAEVCNGEDEDCDSIIDEDFECILGELYECRTSCDSIGAAQCEATCSVPTDEAMCIAPAEVCNGLDDDCVDGADNGFACAIGEEVECMTPCGSTGMGICLPSCEPPSPATCQPPIEVCNGRDDDCIAGPDDTFPCAAGLETECETTCGTIGLGTCTASCELPLPTDCVGVEVCDDLVDNDCDLDVDCTDLDCVGTIACPG